MLFRAAGPLLKKREGLGELDESKRNNFLRQLLKLEFSVSLPCGIPFGAGRWRLHLVKPLNQTVKSKQLKANSQKPF